MLEEENLLVCGSSMCLLLLNQHLTVNIANSSQSRLFDSMEEISSQGSAATGQMPMWLKGSLLRNGPGLMDFGEDKVKSLADGLPMIRKYQVESQMMNMSRRLLESQTLQANLHADRYKRRNLRNLNSYVMLFIFHQHCQDNKVSNEDSTRELDDERPFFGFIA